MDYFVVLTSGGSAGGQPLSWGERQIEMERETVRGEREERERWYGGSLQQQCPAPPIKMPHCFGSRGFYVAAVTCLSPSTSDRSRRRGKLVLRKRRAPLPCDQATQCFAFQRRDTKQSASTATAPSHGPRDDWSSREVLEQQEHKAPSHCCSSTSPPKITSKNRCARSPLTHLHTNYY